MDANVAGPCCLVASFNASRVFEIGMWIGLCTLSLALLVLAWTRWGNVKTTHKCIWLSVLAHLLLVLYAYETRMFLPGTGGNGGEAIVHVTLLSESEDSFDAPPESPTDPVPPTRSDTEDVRLTDLKAPLLLEPDRETEKSEQSEIAVLNPPPIAAPQLLESSDDASEQADTAKIEPAAVAIAQSQPIPIADSPAESTEIVQEDSLDEGPDRVTLGPPRQTDLQLVEPSQPSEAAQPTTANFSPTRHNARPSTSNSSDASAGSNLEATPSPAFRAVRPAGVQPIAEIYSLRNPEQRHGNALKRGGSEGTEKAVENALEWIAKHQQTDGRWNPRTTEAGREFRVLGHDRQSAGKDADTAMTGLALLALMGAGHDHLKGEYRDNVRRGLEFILQSQGRSGHLAGDASLFAHMYSHGIATLAVSEALALTGDARLKPFVDRAVAYSLAAQDPRSGGWRYQPGEEGDMSQFGWQVMALKSAQIGGASIPTTTVQRMRVFLDLCSSGQHLGLASYRPRQAASATMTAEALACRYFLGQSVADRTSDEAAEFILRQPPGSGEIDYYLWYYATLSLYQKGGPHWEQWNRQLQKQLLATQIKQGSHAGSWEPNGKWCGYGGRVFSTALAAMCLEVYYRYLPTLREQVAWNDGSRER